MFKYASSIGNVLSLHAPQQYLVRVEKGDRYTLLIIINTHILLYI